MSKLQDLNHKIPIVNADGTPTQYFMRLLQARGLLQGDDSELLHAMAETDFVADAPLIGGGIIGEVDPDNPEIHIGHDTSGVTPGVYGDTGYTPKLTVNEFGHITDVDDIPAVGGVELEQAGTPVAGGPFSTLNFSTGATVTNAGAGEATIAISGGGGGGGGGSGHMWSWAGGPALGLASVTGSVTGAYTGNVNLALGPAPNNAWYWSTGVTAGVVTFDFGQPVILAGVGFDQDLTTSQGTWAFEGSSDNSTWVTLGSGAWGGAGRSGFTVANTSAYRYYRVRQISGSTSNASWQRLFYFRVAVAASGGGGGGGGSSGFAGMIGAVTSQSTHAFASKAAKLGLTEDVYVSSVNAVITPNSSAASISGFIAEINPSTHEILTVLVATSPVSVPNVAASAVRISLGSEFLLEAGKTYAIGVTRFVSGGTGTTALLLENCSVKGQSRAGPWINHETALYYATLAPAATQTPGGTAAVNAFIWADGRLA